MDTQDSDTENTQDDSHISTEWTEKKVLLLIELFRNESNLWNPRENTYKNKNKRSDSLLNISKVLGVEKAEVERKIKNITSHFYREKRKMESKKSGSGADDNYKTKWFAYPYLEFLKDKNTPRLTQETDEINTQNQCEKSLDQEPLASTINMVRDGTQTEEQIITQEETSNNNTNPEVEQTLKNKINIPKKKCTKRKQEESEDVKDETFKMFKDIYESRKTCDEYSLLGKEVELKVRKLPTHYARCLVVHKIQTTLYEASLGMYNNPPTPQYPTAPVYQHPLGSGQTVTWTPLGPSSNQSNSSFTSDSLTQYSTAPTYQQPSGSRQTATWISSGPSSTQSNSNLTSYDLAHKTPEDAMNLTSEDLGQKTSEHPEDISLLLSL